MWLRKAVAIAWLITIPDGRLALTAHRPLREVRHSYVRQCDLIATHRHGRRRRAR
jgi:hypothetical protein